MAQCPIDGDEIGLIYVIAEILESILEDGIIAGREADLEMLRAALAKLP